MRSQAYAAAGFDTFDMADHYGSAELITGRLLARYAERAARPLAFTKWCPEPGPMTADDRAQGRPGAARPARRRQGRPAAVPLVDVRASGLARRAARDGAAARRRADRRDRRHQFRRRASGAGAGRRRAARHQPGFVLAGRPPRRRRAVRALPRQGRQAAGLRHAVRRLSRPTNGWASPSRPPSPTGAARNTSASSMRPAAGTPSRAFSRAAGADRQEARASRSPMSRRAGCSSTRRSPRRSSARASARASTAPTI